MPRIEEKFAVTLNECERLLQEGRSAEAKDLLDLTVARIRLETLASFRRCEVILKRLAAGGGEDA